MTTRHSALAAGVMVLGVLPLFACGSDRIGAITAPSSVTASSPSPPSSGAVATASSSLISTETATSELTVNSLVPGTACPYLRFMIGSYVIQTMASTQYSGGSCTSIRAGTRLTMDGTRPNEKEMVFLASQITIKSDSTTPEPKPTPKPTPEPTPVSTEGTVTSVVSTTACPDLTFMFGSYSFKVSSGTQYSGGRCADIKAGAKVGVVGSKRDGESSILVSALAFKGDGSTPTPGSPTRPEPTPEPTPPPSVDMYGVVSSIVSGTACPYVKFIIGDHTFVTSRLTQYEHGDCSDIKPGADVRMAGTKRDGESLVLVSKVSFEQEKEPSSDPVSGEAVVTALAGGTECPALEFFFGEYRIRVNAATEYEGGSCSDIRVDTKLKIAGVTAGEKTVLASRVAFQE